EEPRGQNLALSIDVAETPAALRDAMGEFASERLKVRFALPAAADVAYLHRTHPVVQGLAGYVFDSALDAQMSTHALARRAGVVRTRATAVRTTLLLLRE